MKILTYPMNPMTPHDKLDIMDLAVAMHLSDEFLTWLDDNWAIWSEFCALAAQVRARGRSHWSARAILHVLRWNRVVRDATDPVFKINNNWSPSMSRLYNALVGFDFFRERDPVRSAAGYRVTVNTELNGVVEGRVKSA